MGFWNKLGKIALTAAPYVAAPFTGGASLALTGLANKGVSKWSEHDANNAMAKGLAPSSFDKILGKVGNYASLASSVIPTGALGKIGMLGKAAKLGGTAGKVANVASKTNKIKSILGVVGNATGGRNVGNGVGGGTPSIISDDPAHGGISGTLGRVGSGAAGQGGGGWQEQLGGILGNYGKMAMGGGGGGGEQYPGTPPYAGSGPQRMPQQQQQQAIQRPGTGLGPIMPRGGYGYNQNPMNQLNQSNPNLSQSIFQGRQAARQGRY